MNAYGTMHDTEYVGDPASAVTGLSSEKKTTAGLALLVARQRRKSITCCALSFPHSDWLAVERPHLQC